MAHNKIAWHILIALVFILAILGACGPEPEPISQATPIPEGVEIISIDDGQTILSEISQQKVFDQCASASPLKAEIRFSQSSGQELQKELVLKGSINGEAGLSEIAQLQVGGAIEKHFASTNASAQSHDESVGIEIPPHTKQQFTIIWGESRRDGQVDYVENGEQRTAAYSYRVGIELISSTVVDLDCPEQATPKTKSPTVAPAPTYTPYPTFTPQPVTVAATNAPQPTTLPQPTSPPQSTGLTIGQWYTAGNLAFTIDDVYFYSGTNYSRIRLRYVVKNVGGSPITFQYSSYNFQVYDNLGATYPIDVSTGESRTVSLEPGEIERISNPFYGWWDYEGNYANLAVTQVTVVVTGLSQIDRAEWVIPIGH